MKLFHYSTWNGSKIHKLGFIEPSNYYNYLMDSHVDPLWTPVVFLTKNPIWEPSVQAKSSEGYWEKCGSCPEMYTELGIPCWKFEVDIEAIKIRLWDGDWQWTWMLSDATKLGSHYSDWYLSHRQVTVIKSYKWSDKCYMKIN